MKYSRHGHTDVPQQSHPAWGAWIEIYDFAESVTGTACRTPHGVRGLKWLRAFLKNSLPRRTPHGVRGLKLQGTFRTFGALQSHPAWGAWIEIHRPEPLDIAEESRTPHGVRGLKCLRAFLVRHIIRRTPHGVRGLKLKVGQLIYEWLSVAPRMGCVD